MPGDFSVKILYPWQDGPALQLTFYSARDSDGAQILAPANLIQPQLSEFVDTCTLNIGHLSPSPVRTFAPSMCYPALIHCVLCRLYTLCCLALIVFSCPYTLSSLAFIHCVLLPVYMCSLALLHCVHLPLYIVFS